MTIQSLLAYYRIRIPYKIEEIKKEDVPEKVCSICKRKFSTLSSAELVVKTSCDHYFCSSDLMIRLQKYQSSCFVCDYELTDFENFKTNPVTYAQFATSMHRSLRSIESQYKPVVAIQRTPDPKSIQKKATAFIRILAMVSQYFYENML